ncbi:hypothetical protein EZV62_012472 [Acer yangbiense]|uniref:glycerophosphodiester phosphodiesterase n=1 Tax=Acer yangbiense TaxID=1000413 RepID=A0A5C7HWJ8_9ROSI|nr:hypothetical protein EZV62_012472 [Acer yangbiense]
MVYGVMVGFVEFGGGWFRVLGVNGGWFGLVWFGLVGMRVIEKGADFIETDILSSKDGVLICFHDVTLDNTTDVAEHKEFANRKRTYEVQGVNTTDFFSGAVDFTLKELKKLRVK